MPKVLISDSISDQGVEILRQVSDVDVRTDLSPDELITAIAGYDALVVRSATKVTADVIAQAKNLKIIGRAGVGTDNIDVAAATARGIVVVNSPEGNTIAAAELTMALLLSMSRNVAAADASLKGGKWDRSRYEGVEVFDKILGILGLGKIGREVAKRAQAFGMRTIGFDPFLASDVAERLGVELVTLDELLSRSDFITLHLPKNRDTEGLIGKAQFDLMKPEVRIVNAARGGIIDENALAEALKSGKVAAAAIDVYSKEPISSDNPLLIAPNIVTTPHLGASTTEAQSKVAVDVAQQIADYLQGLPARSAVNMPAISADVLNRIRPYLTLAERMGSLITQIADGPVESVQVTYSGEIAGEEISPITRALLTGMLSPIMSERINYVNAPLVADQRGIRVVESKSQDMSDFTSLVTITATTSTGVIDVSGTVFGRNEVRIVRIDGYRIDLIPEGTLLFTSHVDRPGVVGSVGVILGKRGINIGGMHVGREKAGSQAIMALSVDSPIPDDVMEEISAVDGMGSVKQVILESSG